MSELETDGMGSSGRLVGLEHALVEFVENHVRLARVWLIRTSGKPSLVMPRATVEMAPETAAAWTGFLAGLEDKDFQRPWIWAQASKTCTHVWMGTR